MTALRQENSNSIRQTIIAVHNFASTNQGLLPNVDGFLGSRPVFLSVIAAISPYIEGDSVIPPRLIGFSSDPSLSIATTEPAPPPFGISNELPFQKQATSLVFNPLVFQKVNSWPQLFQMAQAIQC